MPQATEPNFGCVAGHFILDSGIVNRQGSARPYKIESGSNYSERKRNRLKNGRLRATIQ